MPSPRLATLALLTAGAATLTLTTAIAPAGAAAAGRAPIRVHLTKAHTVVAPATVHPGRAKLHNSGKGAIVVLESLHGANGADLQRDIAAHSEKKIERDFAILAVLRPHKSVFVRLHRGSVLLAGSDDKPTITTMHVRGSRQDVVLPATSPFAISSAGISAPGVLPQRGLLALTNRTRHLAALVLVRVGSSVSQQTIDDFVAHPGDDWFIKLDPTDTRSFGPVAAGHRSWIPFWIGTGRWVALTLSFSSFHTNAADSFVVR